MNATPATPRRWIRRLIGVLAVLLIFSVLFIGLIPTLVNAGLGRGMVLEQISGRMDGEVSLDALRISWFGEQRVTGLRIVHPDGEAIASVTVDAALDVGLLQLAGGMPSSISMTASVNGRTVRREDGRVAILDVVPASPEEKREPKEKKSPLVIEGLPGLAIAIGSSSFTVVDESSDETYSVNDLSGSIVAQRGGDATVRLDGRLNDDGTLMVDATLSDAIDSAGTLTPASARLAATARITEVDIPRDPSERRLREFEITASSDGLQTQLTTNLRGSIVHDGDRESAIDGTFSINSPVTNDGALDISIASITGSLSANDMPTSLLEPFVAPYGVRPLRDIGEVANVQVVFGEDSPKPIRLDIESEHTSVRMDGEVDPDTRAITARDVSMTQRIDPALIREFTPVRIERPVTVTATIERLSIPGVDDDGSIDLGLVAIAGRIGFSDDVRLLLSAENDDKSEPILLRAVRAQFTSPGLAQGLSFSARTDIDDGGSITANLRIDQLIDANGELDAMAAIPSGTMSVQSLPMQRATMLTKTLPSTIEPLLDDTLSGEIVLTPATAREFEVNTSIRTSIASISADARVDESTVVVRQATATVEATPELAATLQREREKPIELIRPATVTVRADGFTLLRHEHDRWAMTDEVVPLTLERTTLVLDQAPLAKQTMRVRVEPMDIALPLGDPGAIAVKGTAQLLQSSTTAKAADLAIDLRMEQSGDRLAPVGQLTFTSINTPILEAVLGRDPRSLSAWTGDSGTLALDLRPPSGGATYLVTIRPDTEQLEGSFDAAINDETIRISGRADRMVLAQDVVTDFLTADRPAEGERDAPPPVRVGGDVPLRLMVKDITVPRAMTRGEAFDPSMVALDVDVTGGPLVFVDPDDVETKIPSIEVRLHASAFGTEGVLYAVRGTRGEANAAPVIDLNGRLTNLLGDDSTLQLKRATANLEAAVNGIPTMFIDRIIGLDGVLAAAVGATINATIKAEDFSRTSGSLEADVTSPTSSLVASVSGEDQALRVVEDRPIRATLELTPALRERILRPIQPLLADVRSTEQPLTLTASNAVFPLDGDLRRLNADLELTIGNVEFDSGSFILALMAVFAREDVSTVAGSIEPVRLRIRDGVIRYDRFAVNVNRVRIEFTGEVDLATRSVRIQHGIPIDALASGIKELRQVPPGTIVPFETTGTIGSTKTTLKLEGLLESGLEGLINDTINDAAGDELPVRDILDGIFGGGKKKKKP